MNLQQTLREMIWTVFIVCFIAVEANSQVQLTLKSINSINFASQDIWNFDVLNAGTNSINVNFHGVIRNQNGLTLVKLLSSSVVISVLDPYFLDKILRRV